MTSIAQYNYLYIECVMTSIARYTQQTQNIRITFIQRRPNVFDVGPTLYKCYTNVLCLPGNYFSTILRLNGALVPITVAMRRQIKKLAIQFEHVNIER